MVSRIAFISPPGVLRRISTNDAFSCLARAMALPTISVVIGCTMPSTFTAMILGAGPGGLPSAPTASVSVIARIAACRNLHSIYLLAHGPSRRRPIRVIHPIQNFLVTVIHDSVKIGVIDAQKTYLGNRHDCLRQRDRAAPADCPETPRKARYEARCSSNR